MPDVIEVLEAKREYYRELANDEREAAQRDPELAREARKRDQEFARERRKYN